MAPTITSSGFHPSPLPYSQRFFTKLPHPFLGRKRLQEILDPVPGERILEIGPGTGYHSLAVSSWISSDGKLDISDIQQAYLDHTLRVTSTRGISNISATRADTVSLPYESDSFDAAFLVQVLGEVPDQDAALRELNRMLKPTGRLIVGENVLDPHVVTLRTLRRRAQQAGLRFDGATGSAVGYLARFRPEGNEAPEAPAASRLPMVCSRLKPRIGGFG